MRYGRPKITKLLAKNLSLDDRQLDNFALGGTQQHYGGIDESFFDLLFPEAINWLLSGKNGVSNAKSTDTSSRRSKTKRDVTKSFRQSLRKAFLYLAGLTASSTIPSQSLFLAAKIATRNAIQNTLITANS